jgi:hypothetical protein
MADAAVGFALWFPRKPLRASCWSASLYLTMKLKGKSEPRVWPEGGGVPSQDIAAPQGAAHGRLFLVSPRPQGVPPRLFDPFLRHAAFTACAVAGRRAFLASTAGISWTSIEQHHCHFRLFLAMSSRGRQVPVLERKDFGGKWTNVGFCHGCALPPQIVSPGLLLSSAGTPEDPGPAPLQPLGTARPGLTVLPR